MFALMAGSLLCGVPSSAAAQTAVQAGCAEPPASYEARGFIVREIRLESPFDFFRLVRQTMENARPHLPVKEGAPYQGEQVTAGALVLQDEVGKLTAGVTTPVRLSVAAAELVECQSAPPDPNTLVVVYRIFTSGIPLAYSRTFEMPPETDRNPAAGASLTETKAFQFSPTFSYTRTSGFAGGAAVRISHVGPIDAFDGAASASSRNRMADMSMAGSRALSAGGLTTIDWRASYRYRHLHLPENVRGTNVGGADVAVVRSDLPGGGLIRGGASVEGGRASSDFAPDALPAGTVAAADVLSIKAYAGTSWQIPRQAFNVSYAFQASATGDGFGGGFRKHLVDAATRARLLPFDHKPWDIDARATAGWIDNGGRLPASERFFGGNVAEEFLPGSSWSIRANPLIRSFAQSELTQASPDVTAGGEQFVAFNLTFAPTIWGRPLMPRELLDDSSFGDVVSGQWQSAELTLAAQFASETPAVQAFVTQHVASIQAELTPPLEALDQRFTALEATIGPQHKERLTQCETALNTVLFSLPDMAPENAGEAFRLFVSLAPPGRTIDKVIACASDPEFRGDPATGPDPIVAIRAGQARMQTGIRLIDESGSLARAKATLAPAHRVLQSFLHELNIASVAPVLLADAARLAQPGARAEFRYAIGAGIRLSLVGSVHLTTAYAWNLHPKAGEHRGAVFFSLDVSQFLF